MKFTYQQIIEDSKKLASKLKKIQIEEREPELDFKYVFGIPSGGILPAYVIAEELKLELISEEQINDLPIGLILVVDDLEDSGKTIKNYDAFNTAVLYLKKNPAKRLCDYYLKQVPNEWLYLPHDKSETGIEEHITRIFEYIGEDPNRKGLLDTPKRVVKMYGEIFRGYDKKQKPNITVFDNGSDGIVYDQMITDTGNYYSHCEHHMIPFFGQYWFAYIPNPKGMILGLSKVARVVDYHSAKMQIQERLVQDIVNDLWNSLVVEFNGYETIKDRSPLGMALVMKGEHLCKSMRGVKKKGTMTTSDLRGVFKEKIEARQEFFNLIKL